MFTVPAVSLYHAAVVLALTLCDLITMVPMVLLLLLKKFQFVHQQVSSDIPGNPHAFDTSIIAAFRTLPEPSNFNVVWTGLPLTQGPLVMRGQIPGARCNSFNLYGAGVADPPSSVDAATVKTDKNGQFTLLICTQAEATSTTLPTVTGQPALDRATTSFLVANPAWNTGFFAMRNYLVQPGTRVRTPEIRRASDGALVRAPEFLTAGPAGLALHPPGNNKKHEFWREGV